MSRTEKEYLSNKLKVLILIIDEDKDIANNKQKYIRYLTDMKRKIAT